jgi:hydroxyethylthiazole kinase
MATLNPGKTIGQDLERIRAEGPLVHNITNYVVMNTTANALLAIGASPVMAHAREEVEEMVSLASALVINIGTLSAPWVRAMLQAGRAARRRKIPIVLDPVGCGATRFRTGAAQKLMREVAPAIIRGNASEIRSLLGRKAGTKGVDSRHTPDEVLDEARALSGSAGCVVSVSGPVDLIVEGDTVVRIANGHPLMARVTGMGCTASAITGAFAAVNLQSLKAAAHAMAVMGIAGEMAAERAGGPGSFQMHFLDALSVLRKSDIAARLKMQVA